MTTAGKDMTREAQDARLERVVQLTRAGHSAASIAVHVGISKRSVVRARRRAGLTAGYVRAPGPTADQLISGKQMLADGCSYVELSESLGLNPTTWRKHLPGWNWNHRQIGQYGRLMMELGRAVGVTR